MTNVSSWICQKCFRVYSTLMLECDKCNLEITNKESQKSFKEPITEFTSTLMKCERCGVKTDDITKHNCYLKPRCFSCGKKLEGYELNFHRCYNVKDGLTCKSCGWKTGSNTIHNCTGWRIQ